MYKLENLKYNMTNQPLSMDVFDKYLDIMNRLWNLNQSMIRANIQSLIWSNEAMDYIENIKKGIVPDSSQSDDDLPF